MTSQAVWAFRHVCEASCVFMCQTTCALFYVCWQPFVHIVALVPYVPLLSPGQRNPSLLFWGLHEFQSLWVCPFLWLNNQHHRSHVYTRANWMKLHPHMVLLCRVLCPVKPSLRLSSHKLANICTYLPCLYCGFIFHTIQWWIKHFNNEQY